MKPPGMMYQTQASSKRNKNPELQTNYQVAQEVLTFFLQFQDHKLKKEYILYNLHTKNISFLIFLISIYSFIAFPFFVLVLSTQTKASVGHLVLLIVMVLTSFLFSILGWFFILYKLFPRWKVTKSLISFCKYRSNQLRKRSTRVLYYLNIRYPSRYLATTTKPVLSSTNRNNDHDDDFLVDDLDDEDEDEMRQENSNNDDLENNFSYSSHNFYQKNSTIMNKKKSLMNVDQIKTKELFARIQHLLMLLVILCNLTFYINLAAKSDCHEPTSISYLNNFLRNCDDDGLIYVYLFYAFMFEPIIIAGVFKECSFEFHILHHFLIMTLAFITSLVYSPNRNSVIVFAAWFVAGLLFLIDNHIHNVAAFVTSYNLKKTLIENEKTADRMHASEMRHMIGNVAHDLKTPLASFITGLEIIADIVNNSDKILMQKKSFSAHQQLSRHPSMSNGTITVSPFSSPKHANQVAALSPATSLILNEAALDNRFLEYNNSIKQCLQNIRDTNTFMLMTINRCIDYTKASRGFKLVPRFETLNLLETMKLPLDCMKNIQEKIEIQLKPIDFEEICPYVITDKQWLQENILCLLSNAVKYSTDGVVTISASIVKVEPPRPKLTIVDGTSLLNKAPSMSVLAASSNFLRRLSAVSFTRGLTLRGSLFFSRSKRVQDGLSTSSRSAAVVLNDDESEKPTDKELEQQITPRILNKVAPMQVTPMQSDDQIEGNPYSQISTTPTTPPKGILRNNSDPNMNQNRKVVVNSPTCSPRDDTSNSPATALRSALKRGMTRGDLVRDKTGAGATHHIRFEIEDHGIGMSNEAMAELFSPFKQAQRLAGGTGLGLYSLAKRVEALNGAYGVSKRPDGMRGTMFWFSIPYRPDTTTAELNANVNLAAANSPCPAGSSIHQVHIPSNASLPKEGSKQLNDLQRAASRSPLLLSPNNSSLTIDAFNLKLSSLHVLIVDDSPSIVKMSTLLLKRQGHVIRSAENGEIALKTIQNQWETQQRGFDVILMDLQMPVMDGLEATRRLRQMESEGRDWMVYPSKGSAERKDGEHGSLFSMTHLFHPKKFRHAVIGVSANSDHECASDALDAGMDDFIAKPFTMESFNSTVVKVLSKQHQL